MTNPPDARANPKAHQLTGTVPFSARSNSSGPRIARPRGSWFKMIWIANPLMKPARTGYGTNLTSIPRRDAPRIDWTMPETSSAVDATTTSAPPPAPFKAANDGSVATLAINPDKMAACVVFGEFMCNGAPPSSAATMAATTAATKAADMPAVTQAEPMLSYSTAPQLRMMGTTVNAPARAPVRSRAIDRRRADFIFANPLGQLKPFPASSNCCSIGIVDDSGSNVEGTKLDERGPHRGVTVRSQPRDNGGPSGPTHSPTAGTRRARSNVFDSACSTLPPCFRRIWAV